MISSALLAALITFWNRSPTTIGLQVPYLTWVSFTTVNRQMWKWHGLKAK